MDKQTKENLKNEKTAQFDAEILKLQKEREYIVSRHELKLVEIDKRLDEFTFQRDTFKDLKIK